MFFEDIYESVCATMTNPCEQIQCALPVTQHLSALLGPRSHTGNFCFLLRPDVSRWARRLWAQRQHTGGRSGYWGNKGVNSVITTHIPNEAYYSKGQIFLCFFPLHFALIFFFFFKDLQQFHRLHKTMTDKLVKNSWVLRRREWGQGSRGCRRRGGSGGKGGWCVGKGGKVVEGEVGGRGRWAGCGRRGERWWGGEGKWAVESKEKEEEKHEKVEEGEEDDVGWKEQRKEG